MPLRVYIPPGREFYYLRGTVRAGKKTRSIFESAGIGKGEPSAATRAEEIRLRRETEIYNELLYGPKRVVTFTENASDYCEKRNRDRVAENPALAGLPDKEAEYVAKWITFLRRRGLADIPLSEFCDERRDNVVRTLADYFREVHDVKGNTLDTKQREANVYCALMNHAVAKNRASPAFPRPELPAQDIFATPVNKWLYDEEIQLLVKSAGKRLKIFAAGVFATGIRGGEFLYLSRRPPNFSDPLSSGLSLEPGHEFFYLGWTRTKSRKPIVRAIPDWYVVMLQTYLEGRTDQHDALILTPKNQPYRRPRRQGGFRVKTAWKAMRKRAAAVVERLARRKLARGLTRESARLMNRASILRTVTPHWGRHNAASHIVRKGLGKHAAQKAAGWQSERMVERYLHLAPEYAKDLANTLDFGMGNLGPQIASREGSSRSKKRTA